MSYIVSGWTGAANVATVLELKRIPLNDLVRVAVNVIKASAKLERKHEVAFKQLVVLLEPTPVRKYLTAAGSRSLAMDLLRETLKGHWSLDTMGHGQALAQQVPELSGLLWQEGVREVLRAAPQDDVELWWESLHELAGDDAMSLATGSWLRDAALSNALGRLHPAMLVRLALPLDAAGDFREWTKFWAHHLATKPPSPAIKEQMTMLSLSLQANYGNMNVWIAFKAVAEVKMPPKTYFSCKCRRTFPYISPLLVAGLVSFNGSRPAPPRRKARTCGLGSRTDSLKAQ